MRTGHADLPLHGGKAPKWLFERMSSLAREISFAIVAENGAEDLLRRISDPVWFQSFGCVLGFDWHSSGVTTTACGALKDGLKGVEHELGVTFAGGKGKTSRKTPSEIRVACDRIGLDAEPLVRASRLSAKVDSSAVQDGFQVYHHTFAFTDDGRWAVVQQGMNEATGMARRYHWFTPARFDADPHEAVAGPPQQQVLNLVAGAAERNRTTATALAREEPTKVTGELVKMRELEMPRHHWVRASDLDTSRLDRILLKAYEAQPETYTDLLAVAGVGAKGLRALSLVAELAYGDAASIKDPVTFSFAHGGKDGTPFPVDRTTYDATIDSLHRALLEAKVGRTEKLDALKRLARLERARS
ncbi:MAG TPA: DUF763 domain-containing protein [Actinomycetota bacterium]|nr:DUF763 domain-containing protein [Actinomycetota bacterium]